MHVRTPKKPNQIVMLPLYNCAPLGEVESALVMPEPETVTIWLSAPQQGSSEGAPYRGRRICRQLEISGCASLGPREPMSANIRLHRP